MLLGFKKRFTEPILIGTKVFTMRSTRKLMPRVGEQLHMYSGLRTKHSQLITKKEKLISVQRARVLIEKKRPDAKAMVRVFVDGRQITGEVLESFVRFDGFTDIGYFADYWLRDEKGRKKLRTGALKVIFHWTDLRF